MKERRYVWRDLPELLETNYDTEGVTPEEDDIIEEVVKEVIIDEEDIDLSEDEDDLFN